MNLDDPRLSHFAERIEARKITFSLKNGAADVSVCSQIVVSEDKAPHFESTPSVSRYPYPSRSWAYTMRKMPLQQRQRPWAPGLRPKRSEPVFRLRTLESAHELPEAAQAGDSWSTIPITPIPARWSPPWRRSLPQVRAVLSWQCLERCSSLVRRALPFTMNWAGE